LISDHNHAGNHGPIPPPRNNGTARGPVVRMERFTEIGWLVLIPATLLQALVVAVVVL